VETCQTLDHQSRSRLGAKKNGAIG
jgi:hypothetical protein